MERALKVGVVLMMVFAGLYGFDLYYESGGVTGYVVNTAVDCSDADNNNPYVAGVTSSSIYEDGYEEDTCVGDDLLEYYCAANGPDVRAVHCSRGCTAGTCN